MPRPPPYPKKIEKDETLFYYFKLSPSEFSLFDSTMSTPIAYGSYNFVAAVISNLPKWSTIFYFELHSREGWKMKRVIKSNNQPATTKEANQEIKAEKSKTHQLH